MADSVEETEYSKMMQREPFLVTWGLVVVLFKDKNEHFMLIKNK